MNLGSFYLFDWISFTRKDFDTQKCMELLGMTSVPWQDVKGFNGYQERKYYESISIHHSGKNSGIWCEMSGQGCRAFTDFGTGDFYGLLSGLVKDTELANITRIDIAFDDHDGLLDIKKLYNESVKQNYVSRFTRMNLEYSINQRTGINGMSIYHGRKGSDVMIRIYDKNAERGIDDGSHWVRIELQLRNNRALEFVKMYVQDGDESISKYFMGVLNNYLRYVKPNPNDTKKDRWKNAAYWDKFMKSAEKIKLFQKPGIEYNLERMKNFVVSQAGNAIEAMIQIHGLEHFEHLINTREVRENPKYKQIVDTFNRKKQGKPKTEVPEDLSGIPMGMTLDLTTGEVTDSVYLPF